MTDNHDPPIRHDFEAESNALVPDSDSPVSEGFALAANGKMPTLEIDYDYYLQLTNKYDLTEEEQRQFIEQLWNIVMVFVDMGFGIDAASSACGQVADIIRSDTHNSDDVVEWKDTKPQEKQIIHKEARHE